MREYLDWVASVQNGSIGRKLDRQASLSELQNLLEEDEVIVATTYHNGYTHADVISDAEDFEVVELNHVEQAQLRRNLGFYAINGQDLLD